MYSISLPCDILIDYRINNTWVFRQSRPRVVSNIFVSLRSGAMAQGVDLQLTIQVLAGSRCRTTTSQQSQYTNSQSVSLRSSLPDPSSNFTAAVPAVREQLCAHFLVPRLTRSSFLPLLSSLPQSFHGTSLPPPPRYSKQSDDTNLHKPDHRQTSVNCPSLEQSLKSRLGMSTYNRSEWAPLVSFVQPRTK